MSLPFIINNLHFTVEIVGALTFFVMAWLAADAYVVGRQSRPLLRVFGFSLVGVSQLIHALTVSDDLYSLLGAVAFILGLIFVIGSFFTGPKTASLEPTSGAASGTPPAQAPAVLVLPAFASISLYVDSLTALLLCVVAFLSFRQLKKEFDRSLQFFWIGFFVLFLGVLAALFWKGQNGFVLEHLLRLAGFLLLSVWVWQYLQLRLRESVVLIFISLTLLISTIVTLAFSSILMSKIEAETRSSLAIDTKVIDLAVGGLLEEARAKVELLAERGDITNALTEKNAAKLAVLLSDALSEEKLGFLLVTDKQGTVVLRAHALSRYGDSIGTERAVESALTGTVFATIESSSAEKFSIRAAVPLYQKGTLIGVLVAGFPLDNVFADRMKKITGLEMSIYEGESVVATTALGEDGRSRLSGIAVDDPSVREAGVERGGAATARVELRGEEFLASYLPIISGDGKIVGMFSASKSQQEIIALANATNRLTLVAVMSLLLILALPFYFLTRRLLGDEI